MKQILLISLLLIFFSFNLSAQTKKIESIYTDFTEKNCKELKSDPDNGILYRGECRGIGGYKLIFYESEHHQMLNLIAPNGDEIELKMQISAAPTSLGRKAEWRVRREGKKIIPIALVIRMNVFDDPEISEKAKSYLTVIKITKESACVTATVEPAIKNQNLKARQLADVSAEKACILPASDK